ncbi:MAG: hypothetical protein CVV06_20830 [Gammaproteobacteria bacterium HGW-Gammaproteobacteria-10]|nr:MAG: hypothetical protein CVV06_20830 [Gammaproteobacteria bacterium HGW-Gammaproteobacteria-10]
MFTRSGLIFRNEHEIASTTSGRGSVSNSQFGDQKGCGVCLARMSAAGQIFAPAKSAFILKRAVESLKLPFALSLSKGER